MRAGTRRTLIWSAIGLCIAGGLVYAFRPQPVPVDLATVSRGALLETLDEDGVTRIRDVFTLSAPIAGRVLRIGAEAGDIVVAGDTVLARIEPAAPAFLDARTQAEAEADEQAAEAALTLARAELEQARAERDFARSELDRARRLIVNETISERALDEAERAWRSRSAAVDTAEAAVRMRAFELSRARARLVPPSQTVDTANGCDCVPITAPVDGRVLRVLQESEGTVASGTPLLEIGDPRDLEIVADYLSSDAVRIAPGQRVVIDDWGGGPSLAGMVRRVEPFGFTKVSALGIEEQRVNVVIDFTDPPQQWQRLGHGFRVEVRVVVWEGADVVRAPLAALFRNGADWAVFVADHGRAVLRPVVVGRRNDLAAEIVSGLAAGEQIVAHPNDRLADGSRIAARE
jgi:HlyD family secretion protein